MNPKFSIVAPIYNEIDALPELYSRVSSVMEEIGDAWELVMVDDGSSDGSTQKIMELYEQDRRVRPVLFSRNFGHQIAVTAGLDYSRGEAVVIIDSDLQDPPEVIQEMIERWREGYEVVYAVRTEREGETWFKEFTASLFYRIIYRITDVAIPMDTGDFRLLDRKAVDVMGNMRERHRFLRGMSVWVGFKQIGVEYKREARFAGETKYPLRKMTRFATDAITSFSYFPLQLASYLGFFSAALAILAIPIVMYLRLTGSQAFFGQATTLIAVLFIGGVQLISLGILGEYIGRVYDEVKHRPLYVVAFSPPEDPEA
ncbi:MAG: glycosyltransferase family 2 protein [Anaerolineales bacterium]|nr:glycosyltransferase family 2 protein [Anaerolineales bacterium]